MPHRTIEQRQRWWRECLGAPRYVMAPMVLQSELAFRLLARQHGCTLCYSPMLPATSFLASAAATDAEHPDTGGPATQEAWFTTALGAADRPLIVQLGGSDLDELVAAARLVQHRCDGIDLNLGCPQRIAHSGTRRSRELPPLISDQRTGTAAGTGTGGGMGHPRLYPLLTPSAIASAQATLDRTCSARRTAPSCSAS